MSGIPAWAVPGAKVVCIRTMTRRNGGPVPVVGQTYVVRHPHVSPFGDAVIGLEEIVDPLANYKLAPGLGPFWLVEWFRPLVTRSQEQDIATHFRDLLRQPEPVA